MRSHRKQRTLCTHWEQLVRLAMTVNGLISCQPAYPSWSPVFTDWFICRWLYSSWTQMNSWRDLCLSCITHCFFCTVVPSRAVYCIAVLWQQLSVIGREKRVRVRPVYFVYFSLALLVGSLSCPQAETHVNGCSPVDATWGITYGSPMAAWCTNTKASESQWAEGPLLRLIIFLRHRTKCTVIEVCVFMCDRVWVGRWLMPEPNCQLWR